MTQDVWLNTPLSAICIYILGRFLRFFLSTVIPATEPESNCSKRSRIKSGMTIMVPGMTIMVPGMTKGDGRDDEGKLDSRLRGDDKNTPSERPALPRLYIHFGTDFAFFSYPSRSRCCCLRFIRFSRRSLESLS
jgi:hypothetical protein